MSMADKSGNQRMVEAIANGTVIDHIAPGQAINILRLFHFIERHTAITVGFNLRSGSMGSKDIIKISDVTFSPNQTEQMAILAPDATVNNIKDYKVVDKNKLRLPKETIGSFSCPNRNCISNHETDAPSRFKVDKDEHGKIIMRCHYCEREFEREIVLSHNEMAD